MSLSQLLSPDHLITSYGLIGIMAIIFAETGLFIGFFLPGDTLLFLGGALATTSEPGAAHLSLAPLMAGAALAAIIGAQTGFYIGRWLEKGLLERPDHRIIQKRHIDKARSVLERYGEFKAVLFARVIPIVRTFINPVVGALGMNQSRFLLANVIGGVIWTTAVIWLGYKLGGAINIDKYILPIMSIVIVASAIPVAWEWRRNRRGTDA